MRIAEIVINGISKYIFSTILLMNGKPFLNRFILKILVEIKNVLMYNYTGFKLYLKGDSNGN